MGGFSLLLHCSHLISIGRWLADMTLRLACLLIGGRRRRGSRHRRETWPMVGPVACPNSKGARYRAGYDRCEQFPTDDRHAGEWCVLAPNTRYFPDTQLSLPCVFQSKPGHLPTSHADKKSVRRQVGYVVPSRCAG